MVEDAVVNAQLVNMCLAILQGDDGTLLHDVAQVAGQRQLASLSFRQRGLDKQYLAAHTGPCQSGDDTGVGIALIDVSIERRFAQQVFYLCGSDLFVGQFAVLGFLESQLAQRLVDLLLQLADAALTGILLYHLFDGSLVERQLLVVKTRIVLFLRYQVALGNLQFLFGDVAGHLDNLHAVE